MNNENLELSSITTTEVILPGIVEPNGLLIEKRHIEKPKQGQVILRMEATGISFAEKSMIRDRYSGQPKFPFVPGYDLVGTVVALGPDIDYKLMNQRF